MKNRKVKQNAVRQVCDPKKIEAFDYSKLGAEFAGLGKPAQRALVNNGVYTAADLRKRGLEEVMKFHGMGPSSLPVLKKVLKQR